MTVRSEALRSQGLFSLETYNRFLIPQIVRGAQHREVRRQEVYNRNEDEVTAAIRKHLGGMTRWSELRGVSPEENT